MPIPWPMDALKVIEYHVGHAEANSKAFQRIMSSAGLDVHLELGRLGEVTQIAYCLGKRNCIFPDL